MSGSESYIQYAQITVIIFIELHLQASKSTLQLNIKNMKLLVAMSPS